MKTKYILGVAACLILVFFGLQLWAQDATLTATVSQKEVTLNDQFQLTFTLNGNGRNFQPPALNDFHVLMGPNQSTSMQIINGNISQSLSFSYYLQAKNPGTFKIGPAAIEAGGKRIQSNTITITVLKGAGNPQAGGGHGGGGSASENDLGKNLFLQLSVNKNSVYQGEAVIATYKIYTRLNIVNYGMEKLPVYNGFWSHELEMPKQLDLHKEVLDGVAYSVGEIKRVILYPQRSGILTIDPMEGECVVRMQMKRRRSNDPFDQLFNDPFFDDPFFGGGRYQDMSQKLKSNSLKINVKALPANAPESFGGAVGKFSIETKMDKNTTKTNDPVSIKLKISGSGNIKLVEAPKVSFPGDFETFDPKVTENVTVGASGLSGSKSIEYLFIPRHAGEYKINPVEFSYFDLDRKSYVTLKGPEFKLHVDKGSENEASVVAGNVDKEDIKMLGKDIRYIKTNNTDLEEQGEDFYDSPGFYGMLVAPVLLSAGAIFYRRRAIEMNKDVVAVKSRRATRMAKKRLEIANKYLKEQNKEKFYEEVSKALWGYISDKINIPVANLSKDEVSRQLKQRNVKEETIGEFTKTIDLCEFARFAPSSGNGQMEGVYSNSIDLITRFEDEI